MTAREEAPALWGSAQNAAYPVEQRLTMALRALDYYGGLAEQQEAEAEAQEDPTPEGAVAAARTAGDALAKALHGYEPEDWRDAVRLLHRLRTAVEVLRVSDANLVRWLYLHGEHGQHQLLDGVGAFSITRGRSKERWQVEPAVRDYVETRIRQNDGEMPDPDQVVAWCLEVLPSGESVSVKKTPLRKAGLDVDDYYSSEPGSLQVGLPRPEVT